MALSFSSVFKVRADDAISFDKDYVTLKITHTGCMHGHVYPNVKKGHIGMARFKSIMDMYFKDADMTLVLDSGDTFCGSYFAQKDQGAFIAGLYDYLGYDAMAVGNHDFSYGKERLKAISEMTDVKMLSGNVLEEDTKNPYLGDDYLIKTFSYGRGTLTVGVFGLLDPSVVAFKRYEPWIAGLEISDLVDYANGMAKSLKEKGCDVVIALSHASDPILTAERVTGVDLWLNAQYHMPLKEKVYDADGKLTYVMRQDRFLKSVGLIKAKCYIDTEGNISSIKWSLNNKSINDSIEDIDGISYDIDEIEEDKGVKAYIKKATDAYRKKPALKVNKRKFTVKKIDLKKSSKTLRIKTSHKGKGKVFFSLSKCPKGGRSFIKVMGNGKVVLKNNAPKGRYVVRVSLRSTLRYKAAKKTVIIRVR